MSSVGQLTIDMAMNILRLSKDMDAARGLVQNGMGAIEKAAAGATRILGGLGIGLSIGMFTGWVRGAIDAADEASKTAQKIGVLTSDVAGLELAFNLAGQDASVMQSSLAKLARGVADGNSGLKALKVSTTEVGGGFRNTKDVLFDIADKFAEMPDGIQKTALAVEIFGKAGAGMIPLLNGGSAGMREMADMAERLGLVISEDTGKKAEQFNDTMELIQKSGQGLATKVMAQLLPTLNSLASAFLETKTSGDGVSRTADIIAAALKMLYSVAVGVVEIFSTLGKGWGMTFAAIGAAMRGDFSMAATILKEGLADIGTGWKDTSASIQRAWSDQSSAAITNAAKMLGVGRDLLADQKAREEGAKRAAAEAKKAMEAFDALVARLGGKEAGVDSDFLKNLRLINEEGKRRGMNQAELNALIESYIKTQPYMVQQEKDALEVAKERQKVRQQEAAQIEEYMRAESARLSAQVKGAKDALELAKDELANRGKLRSRIEQTTIARLREQLVTKTAGTEAYEALQREIETREELVGVLQSTELAEANEKVAKEAEAQWKQVSDSFVDNLMQGGKNIAQYLKDLFRTLVLRPLLQPIGNMMASGVNSLLGGATGGDAGGSLMGSVGSSIISGAANYLGATAAGGSLMAGFSGASAALAGGSTFGVTGAIGGYSAAIGTGATGVAGAASSIASGASAAMAAIPVAGWVALAAVALWSIFGNEGGGPKVESVHDYLYAGSSTPVEGLGGMPQGGNAKQISDSIEGAYAGIASQLGLLTDTLQVGVLLSQDPEGDADTILGVEASTGYSRNQRMGGTENVGRSEEELKAAIGEETVRVIFDALKASDLSSQYKEWLNAATGGTVAEMQAAIDRVITASTERQRLEAILFDLTATDLEKLNKARDAERAAVGATNLDLLEQVYAQQDLQRATASTTASLAEQAQRAKDISGSYVEYMRLMGRLNAGIPLNLPAHADGGVASGWSIVGEEGPEVVDFDSPAQVYPADQTRGMFSGGGSELGSLLMEVRDELRAMRNEDGARAEVIKGAALQTAAVLTYIKTNGMPLGEDMEAGG